MTYRDVLLHLQTFPAAVSLETVDEAMSLACRLGRSVTGLAFEVHFQPCEDPTLSAFLHVSEAAQEEEHRSAHSATALLAHFEDNARRHGVFGSVLKPLTQDCEAAERLAVISRARDLCILPYGDDPVLRRALAEAVVFGAGRPALVLPAAQKPPVRRELNKVLIAWDGGRCSARAVADALPILPLAEQIEVLTLIDEKAGATRDIQTDLVRHLALHDIRATPHAIDCKDCKAQDFILERIREVRPDLVVMGAYRRESGDKLMPGNVTDSFLRNPSAPLFLAH